MSGDRAVYDAAGCDGQPRTPHDLRSRRDLDQHRGVGRHEGDSGALTSGLHGSITGAGAGQLFSIAHGEVDGEVDADSDRDGADRRRHQVDRVAEQVREGVEP